MNYDQFGFAHPKFSELSEQQKDEVIELILAHFGRRIEVFKLDGSKGEAYLAPLKD